MNDGLTQSGRGRYAERMIILAAAYFVAGYIGLQIPYFGSTVTLIWAPSGIALAGLLCWGLRYWPGIAAGAFAVNFTTGVPLESIILITIGNSFSGIAGAWMLRRFSPARMLSDLRSLVLFLLLGVMASPLISSLSGAAVISATILDHWQQYGEIWWGWWIGDLMGVLLFAPVLVLLGQKDWRYRSLYWYCELAFLVIGAGAVSVLVHSAEILARQEFLFIFVSLPFALWGALRFGLLGASLVNLVVCLTAVIFLAQGESFFIESSQQESLIRFYGFFCFMGVSSLLLARGMESILQQKSKDADGISMDRVRRMRVMLALSAGGLGLSLSIAAATITHDQIEHTEKLELQAYAVSYKASLQGLLEKALDPLYSIKVLMETQSNVTRETFKSLISPWLARNPDIQALEWIPIVTAVDRPDYVAQAEEDGLNSFDFREMHNGEMVSAAMRDLYYPVYYVVPEKSNEKAIGFDLGSSPIRLAALKQTMERDDVTITEPITLIQDTGNQSGILVFLPVRDQGTGEMRGFALGVFRLGNLLQSVLKIAVLPGGYEVHVLDDNTETERRLLFSTEMAWEMGNDDEGEEHDHEKAMDHARLPEHTTEESIEFGGRVWSIQLEARDRVHGLIWDWQP